MVEKLVEIKNVSVKVGGSELLKNIDLAIMEGEQLGILGRSGSGKSVLLSVLRGHEEYKPAAGEVIYHVAICEACERVEASSMAGEACACGGSFVKREVDFWADKNEHHRNLIKQRVAIMLQRTFNLYGTETVLENVMKPLLASGYSSKNAINRAVELLDSVNMLHRPLYLANDLSGGEKQRVVLARQLAMDPILFLADEPTGTLDPKTAIQVESTIQKNIRDANKSLILTSHWHETIERLAGRVILFDQGEITAEGKPKDIIEEYLERMGEVEEREEREFGAPIIECRNIQKHFYSIGRGIVKAVDGVDLTIYENEIFGIVGMSGAGKTTLSKILAGLTPGYSNYKGICQIRVGEDWVNMATASPARGRAREHMATLHQEYGLFSYKSVRDNLVGAVPEIPDEFAKITAVHMMEAVGFEPDEIEDALDRMPGDLSEGERQRVIFAHTLIREPRILILDEPTGTMDPITRVTVANTVKRVRSKLDTTVIVISHDVDFVKAVCDHAAFMSAGKIECIGSPDEVIGALYAKEGLEGV
ncbi:methyl coenzyme M reductase system, component A2 [Methanosarcinales archaeon ex4572_44]|nr:MAG: methyl coenzyme M reductase system, component A2 [Methanosarcinales archaeon ex4484_138]PHP45849.1 MAG: methyl coenzyme M reductase system, component A2 [Methanosarcinales archaeon ex4572_44]